MLFFYVFYVKKCLFKVECYSRPARSLFLDETIRDKQILRADTYIIKTLPVTDAN